MKKAIGRNGPPRRLATPHGTMGNGKTRKMGRRGTRRNPTEHGETPGSLTGGRYPPKIRLFSRFSISPLSFPPPFPNTQRFGGFETPGIGWRSERRSDGKGNGRQCALKSTLRKFPFRSSRVHFSSPIQEMQKYPLSFRAAGLLFGWKRLGNRREPPRSRHTHCGSARRTKRRPAGFEPAPYGL